MIRIRRVCLAVTVMLASLVLAECTTSAALASTSGADRVPSATPSACIEPQSTLHICGSADGGGVTVEGSETGGSETGGRTVTLGPTQPTSTLFTVTAPPVSRTTCRSLIACAPFSPATHNGLVDNPDNHEIMVAISTGVPSAAFALGNDPQHVITIDDVAHLLPAQAPIHSDLNGWVAVGLPANFWVDGSVETAHGPLLGADVDVRFTPVGYTWYYGDATAQSTNTPGASWSALSQSPLTHTATSHRYLSRGSYQVQVQITFGAEYRANDGAWHRISGIVIDTTPAIGVLAVTERTALTPSP